MSRQSASSGRLARLRAACAAFARRRRNPPKRQQPQQFRQGERHYELPAPRVVLRFRDGSQVWLEPDSREAVAMHAVVARLRGERAA